MLELVVLLMLSQQPVEPIAQGMASYYTVGSSSARTASGETLRDGGFSCAMRAGELGDYVLVVAENGRSVVCRVNDRGPFVKGRVIDLSKAAMRQLHPSAGLIRVRIYPINHKTLELLHALN